ncbi:hypothetical protein I7X12_14945 [Halosimplex litoreum]|uniref:Uncharacterized protein n=1 Tax=Halosimplex litoreum TaxID=1198301 RepID=A0A7T3FWN3_9EURY|nr:hypothetical protein [Halosimplex litoreum]QPV62036.1 hypothetical protein I7X12_14945 [Halosimplex litoreum]
MGRTRGPGLAGSGRLLVAVALVVVLAGCSVFAGGGQPTPAQTVTPAPVPDLGPTDTPPPATPRERLGAFPAISAEGDINVSGLFTAHIAYLSDHSYTLEWNRRTAGGSGPIAREYDRRIAVGADGSFLVRNADEGTNTTVTYGDRDGAYRRVEGSNGADAEPVPAGLTDPVGQRYAETVSFEILTFLNEGYDSVEVVTRNGRPYARVVSDNVPPQIPETYSAYAVHDFAATLWIAPEGYVSAVHYEFDLRNIDERIAVEWRYTYDRVGETTVDRPEWVPESTPVPSPTPTDDPSRVPPATVASTSTAD